MRLIDTLNDANAAPMAENAGRNVAIALVVAVVLAIAAATMMAMRMG